MYPYILVYSLLFEYVFIFIPNSYYNMYNLYANIIIAQMFINQSLSKFDVVYHRFWVDFRCLWVHELDCKHRANPLGLRCGGRHSKRLSPLSSSLHSRYGM